MIFITLGSQKFQFNRLLKAVDELIKNGVIQDKVFAQIGYSDYSPKYFKYKQFLEREEFVIMEEKADVIITHGGTGAIIGAVKMGKKVIAVPRLAKYGEHVDDHQLQLIGQFTEMRLIEACYNLDKLEESFNMVKENNYASYESNTKKILNSIDEYISSHL